MQGGLGPDASSLIRSLLALPELGMRLGWLGDKLDIESVAHAAAALDELAQLARRGEHEAREALLAVVLFLVEQRDTSLLWALRTRANKRAHLDLERLLRQDPEEPEPAHEAARAVPDFGVGRELTVGERRSLARRPTRTQLERLLDDPHPLVLEQLLACPKLTEADVLRMITRRPPRLGALLAVTRSLRWMARRAVRRALILNPGCPSGVAVPLVGVCPRDDLVSVVAATTLSLTVRTVAHELLARLPPIQSECAALQ
jgi:hypothetical protein